MNIQLVIEIPKDGSTDKYHLILDSTKLETIDNVRVIHVRSLTDLPEEDTKLQVTFLIDRADVAFSHGDDWLHGSMVRASHT